MSALVIASYMELAEELRGTPQSGELALTNGCFDLVHVGHVRLLGEASRLAGRLVVALNDDGVVRRSKGKGRPVVPLVERMEVIAALTGVDYVTSFPEPTADALLKCLRPDIYVKGTDWTPETLPEAATVREIGARVVICGDPKSHSSTQLAQRLQSPDP